MSGAATLQPPLISSLLDAASESHAVVEVVSRSVDGRLGRANWAEVARRARRLTSWLRASGLAPGARVATIAWNHQRHLELYFAIPAAGGVLHPLDPRMPVERLADELARGEHAVVFYDRTFETLVQRAMESGPAAARCVCVTDDVYEPMLGSQPDNPPWPAIEETAPCCVYADSLTGTLSHAGVVEQARALVEGPPNLQRPDVILAAAPMSRGIGLALPYAAAMVGAKLVLPGHALDARSLHTLIETERVTRLVGPAPVFGALQSHLRSIAAKLGTVRTLWVQDGSLSPGFMEAWAAHGVRVIGAAGLQHSVTSPGGGAVRAGGG
jgi:3-(methylthio)propionyl---CoA ligase